MVMKGDMVGLPIDSEIMSDGSGRWIIHLDHMGKPLCGKANVRMRTGERAAANCDKCLANANGVLTRASRTNRSLDNLDFCVSFVGENAGLLAQLSFGTLERCCDLSGVTFHIVNKNLSLGTWSAVLDSVVRLKRPVRTYNLSTGWDPYKGAVDSFSFDGVSTPVNFDDAARTAEWVVDNCGDAEWCVLSHFDVIWRQDILNWLVKKQESTSAMMVGSHCPVMLLNRSAYRRCGVGFDSKGAGDVGIALGKALGAEWFEQDPAMEWCFSHMGGGGSYHSLAEFQSMRDRALDAVRREGL